MLFDDARLLVVVHSVLDIDPKEPSNIPNFVALELTQQVPHKSCLKDFASRNISFMLITLEGCHFEMSPLNDDAPRNIPDISFTFDTSQSPMEQIAGNTLMHLSRAPLSSAVDRGANAIRAERRGKGIELYSLEDIE